MFVAFASTAQTLPGVNGRVDITQTYGTTCWFSDSWDIFTAGFGGRYEYNANDRFVAGQTNWGCPAVWNAIVYNREIRDSNNKRIFPPYFSVKAEEHAIWYPFVEIQWGIRIDSEQLYEDMGTDFYWTVFSRSIIGHDDAGSNFTYGGYTFHVMITIPKLAKTNFYTRDANTQVTRKSFCLGEDIYLDNDYKLPANTVNNSRFRYEFVVDGRTYTYTTDNPRGEISVPTDDFIINDPTKKTTAVMRTRMIGPQFGGGGETWDGLVGPWSDTVQFKLYPRPPYIDTNGLGGAPYLTARDRYEKSTSQETTIRHISCPSRDDGAITIKSLIPTQQYAIFVWGPAGVMDFKVTHATDSVVIPDYAYNDPTAFANNKFRFTAGDYTIAVQTIVPGTPNSPETIFDGCAGYYNFNIKEPTKLNVVASKFAFTGNVNVSCADVGGGLPSQDGRITITSATGGLTPYSYTLSPVVEGIPSGPPVTQTSAVFPGLPALRASDKRQFTYSLTAKDGGGCEALVSTPTFTLTIPDKIVIDLFPPDNGGTNIKCFGGTANTEIRISGGVANYTSTLTGTDHTYSQSSPSLGSGQPYTYPNLTAGQYKVSANDVNNCHYEQLFVFTQHDKIDIESNLITPATCFDGSNGSIKFNAKGGAPFGDQQYQYTLTTNPMGTAWPVQTTDIAAFSDLPRTNYLLNVADALGCNQFFPMSVGSSPEIIVTTVATDVICFGTTSGTSKATFSGGTAPYTLDWMDGSHNNITTVISQTASNNTLSDRPGGQYYARITDSKGCKKESLSTISAPSSPLDLTSSTTADVTCNGLGDGKVSLNAQGGWPTYLFSKGGGAFQAGNSFQSLAPGSYTFNVKDAKGCTDSFDITITEPEPLTVSADDLKPVSCFGESNGAFTPDIAGGSGFYSIYDATLGWVTPARVEGLPTGNYHLMVRDSRACTTSADILIPAPTKLVAAIQSATDTRCGEANGAAQVNVSGGTLPYSAEWDLDGNILSTDLNPTGLPAGVYDVFILDANDCSVPLTAAISSSNGADIVIQNTTPVTCSDSSDGTAVVTVSGGTLPYVSIEWTNGETGLSATTLLKGANFISIEDNVGCVVTKQVDIDGPDAIIGNFMAISPKCFGDMDGSLVVEASGGIGPYQYQWVNTTNNTTEISSIGQGDYSVSITDSKGCNAVSVYTLTQPDPVVVELSGAEVLCTGQTTTLDAGNAGATYNWTATNGFASSERIVTVSQSGTYTVLVTDPQGCNGTDSFELSVDDNLLQADFLAASEAIAGDTVVLINITFPAPDSTYWSFPNGGEIVQTTYYTQEVVFEEPGDYPAVLYATLGGCKDDYEGSIHVIEELPGDEESGDNGRKSSIVKSFNIHPNPTNGRFRVSVDLNEEVPVMLDIISMKAVSTQARYSDYGKSYYELDVSLDVSPGVYTVMLKAGDERLIKRIIIY